MTCIRQSVHSLCQAVKQRLRQWAKHSVDSPRPDHWGVTVSASVGTRWGASVKKGKLPPKYVPLEVVFIVNLWQCLNSPTGQGTVAVVGLWILWAGTLFVAVHSIHSQAGRSLSLPRPSLLDIRQGWYIADRGVSTFGIVTVYCASRAVGRSWIL